MVGFSYCLKDNYARDVASGFDAETLDSNTVLMILIIIFITIMFFIALCAFFSF